VPAAISAATLLATAVEEEALAGRHPHRRGVLGGVGRPPPCNPLAGRRRV